MIFSASRGFEEVQHHGEDHGGGLAWTDKARDFGMGEQVRQAGQVALDGGDPVACQDRGRMPDDHRVDVGVDDPAGRGDALRGLVSVTGGRQARPNVQELPDALPGHPRHRTDKEVPVLPGQPGKMGVQPDQSLSLGTVGGEVVLASKPEVIDAGDIGRGYIEPGPGSPVCMRSHGSPGARACNVAHLPLRVFRYGDDPLRHNVSTHWPAQATRSKMIADNCPQLRNRFRSAAGRWLCWCRLITGNLRPPTLRHLTLHRWL